jgi:asparagine synthetase B (glutamine-hydrolysing)
MTLDVDRLRYLIQDAVLSKYEEGSSTGVLLSGGIDSSTVACIASDLPCFTGYYAGEAYDERPWASVVAKGREWHEIEITPQDFLDNIDACLACLEPPFEGPGTFGQYMVAKYVSKRVDVVLSGEGGDELFGGYARLIAVAGGKMPEGYEDYVPPLGYPETLTEALAWEWEHLPALLRVDEQVTKAHNDGRERPSRLLRAVARPETSRGQEGAEEGHARHRAGEDTEPPRQEGLPRALRGMGAGAAAGVLRGALGLRA